MFNIKTKDFILRPLRLADAKGYWEVMQDEETKKNLTTWPKSFKEAKNEINELLLDVKEGGSVVFTILVDKKYAGNVVLQPQNWDIKTDEGRIHLWIHPKFRRNGLATLALKKLIEYGFGIKKLKRIFVQCKAINKGVMKIMKNLGFFVIKKYTNEAGIKKVLWVIDLDKRKK